MTTLLSGYLSDFIVGVIIAAVAVVLATRLGGQSKTNKARYWAIFCVVIVASIWIKDTYVEPKYEEWSGKATFDKELGNREPYATLRRTFPADYDRIREVILKSAEAGESRNASFVKGRAVFMRILVSKLRMASDEAITGFMQLTLNTATYYYNNGQPERAFDIIYDQKSLPRDWYKALPKEFGEAENETYKQIFTSASNNEPRQTDEIKAGKLIETITSELYSEDGEDVELMAAPLSHPEKSAPDRTAVHS